MKRLAVLAAVLALVACKPANSAAARETVRGAIFGTANAVELATVVCARVWQKMDEDTPEAKRLFSTCKNGWDDAEAALEAADKIVDTWDAATSGAKLACLGGRALAALQSIVTALDEVGVPMDAALRATIDDGIALARWMVAIAPGGVCQVPAKGAAL